MPASNYREDLGVQRVSIIKKCIYIQGHLIQKIAHLDRAAGIYTRICDLK